MSSKPVRHRKEKSHKLSYAAVSVLIAIIFIATVYVFVLNVPTTNYLTYANVAATDPPLVDRNCTFGSFWSSPLNVSGYIFSSNITGQWINETWTAFSASENPPSAWSRVTRFLNYTVGTRISWRFFANNTENTWSQTLLQTTRVTSNRVLLITSMGNITIDLYADMPITTSNFRGLVDGGTYDNTTFHRVINNATPYMIQGGDPTTKGAPSTPTIQDELPNKHTNVRGTIAMANAGPNTGSSQFFINHRDNTYLDSAHPVFGQVIIGMDIVEAISNVPRDSNDKPLQPVYVIKAMLIRP
jgi:peptidylprolyl isomerase